MEDLVAAYESSEEEIPSQSTTSKRCTPTSLPPDPKRRYVSKREREAAAAQEATQKDPQDGSERPSGPIVPNELPERIEVLAVQYSQRGKGPENTPPRSHSFNLLGHGKSVNTVRWSIPHGDLLASASMDGTVRVWDVFRSRGELYSILHAGGCKDVQWNQDGTRLISGGFDRLVRLTDVETGRSIQEYPHEDYVTALHWHPIHSHLFLSGSYHSGIRCWDTRTNSCTTEYSAVCGDVQDLAFLPDGRTFFSSTSVTKRNSQDKGIIAWNFETGVEVSSQVYLEAYTCPALRVHPFENHLIAQSNADYIAIFSTRPPFKLNKRKRLEGHRVSGYHIQCNFSPDGHLVVTGAADGRVFFYNWGSGNIRRSMRAHSRVCMDAVFHPLLKSMIATCSWDGVVSIFE